MPDMDMVKDILKQILNALQKIQWRFAPVNSADEFTDTPQGMEKLDSICMLLTPGEARQPPGLSLRSLRLCERPAVISNHSMFDVGRSMFDVRLFYSDSCLLNSGSCLSFNVRRSAV